MSAAEQGRQSGLAPAGAPPAQGDGSGVWVVADPRSSLFGQVFQDDKALESATHKGQMCLVTTSEGILLLERAESASAFRTAYCEKARKSGFVGLRCEEETRRPSFREESQRLLQLSQVDIFTLPPDLATRRLALGMLLWCVYIYMATMRYYSDTPPSPALVLLITLAYPCLLYLFCRLMQHRAEPIQENVMEILLALDVYQLTSSIFTFLAIAREAYALGLLFPPWGNSASISSPWLRKLLWLHYHNRIMELWDTVIRISQKKFKAYGAVHVYLRLIFLWGWLANCRLGGGDAYFLTLLDSAVTSVRFCVFTLTLLRLNWNIEVDFGLHAPKVSLFRKQHLYHVQMVEFALLAVHALCCAYWGTMSRWLCLLQLLAMVNGMSIFTDWHCSMDLPETPEDSRLTFSFDSSCWLFIYHFGVAKWLQDHVRVTPADFAFSGSSGGALVAAVLACDLDPEDAKNLALADFRRCQRNPFHMFRVGEHVLDHYLRDTTLHERCSGHLRVLLTKVSSSPPLLQAEVASVFKSWHELFSCLRASMHVPLAAGILPYPIAGRGWYFDGLVWAALFVPWRAFSEDDVIVRVSACGFPNAQIGPRVPFPVWWLIVPPSAEVLHAMFWMGYRDAGRYFSQAGRRVGGCCDRRSNCKAPRQVEALMEHLRPDPVSRLDERAERLIATLEATAAWHWRVALMVAMGVLCPVLALVFWLFS